LESGECSDDVTRQTSFRTNRSHTEALHAHGGRFLAIIKLYCDLVPKNCSSRLLHCKIIQKYSTVSQICRYVHTWIEDVFEVVNLKKLKDMYICALIYLS
jgi:hypothetical protein